MICYNCNKNISENSAYCRFCGAKVKKVVNLDKTKMSPSERKELIEQIKHGTVVIANNVTVLFESDYNGKTIFEYLLEFSKESFTAMKEEVLLQKFMGKTLLERLIKKNYVFNDNKTFFNPKSAEILYKCKDYYGLKNCDLSLLVSKANLNYTYLEYFLDYRLNAGEILGFDCTKVQDNSVLAKIIITFCKLGLRDNIRNLTPEILMSVDEKQKRLIDELFRGNKAITTKSVLTQQEYKDLDLYRYVSRLVPNLPQYQFDINSSSLVDIFVQDKLESKKDIKLDDEYEELLNTFKELMLSDNKSNKKMVETTVLLYRELIANNDYYAGELEMLISIKQNVPSFSIKQTAEDSYYSTNDRSLYIGQLDRFSTIHHEMGHALHYLLADASVLQGYESIAESIRKDPQTITKITFFNQKCYKEYEEAKKKATEKYSESEHTSLFEEISSSTRENVDGTLKWLEQSSLELGFSKDEVGSLLHHMPNADEVMNSIKESEIFKLTWAILFDNDEVINSISDIIDAIFLGDYFDGKLKDLSGRSLYCYAGHGGNYYKSGGTITCFTEIIANYSAIVRSRNPEYGIGLLRSICGDEFVDSISVYYEKNIKGSKKLDTNKQMA